MRGPWQLVRASLERRGHALQVWKDVRLESMESMEVWPIGRDLAVLIRKNGERVGLARLP